MSYKPVNIWDEINNPKGPEYEYWGKIDLFAYQAVLVKGAGKIPYSPGQVMPDGSEPRPVGIVKIEILPLPEMQSRFPVLREIIANKNNEWGEIVLPSLRDLGVMSVETINGKWGRVALTPTGRKYTNQNGEEKEATTFKFVAIFDTEQLCRADYAKSKNGNGSAQPVQQSAAIPTPAAPTNGNGSAKDYETALKFLTPLVKNAWKNAGGDLEKARQELTQKIANQPLLNRHFTVDSTEVMDVLMAEAAK